MLEGNTKIDLHADILKLGMTFYHRYKRPLYYKINATEAFFRKIKAF
jgi:hypothetical protein